jgi:sugar lactone lactonase YvrE
MRAHHTFPYTHPSALILCLFLFQAAILPACSKSGSGSAGTTSLSFTPATDTVGAAVTITGTDFGTTPEADVVTFAGGVQARLLSATASALTVEVPTGAINGKITVRVRGGLTDVTSTTAADFNVALKFFPQSEGAGYPITLSGFAFSTTPSENVVKFNGASGTTTATVTAAAANTLTIAVPAGATQGTISVTVNGQTTTTLTSFTPAPIGVVTTLAGNANPGNNPGLGTAASFNQPQGLTTDDSGNIYVADYGNNLIRKITPAGMVTTFAGNGSAPDMDGTQFNAQFYAPTSLVFGLNGALFVTDILGNRVREISGGNVTTLSDNAYIPYSIYFYPTGISADAAGDIFFANQDNDNVDEISAAGIATIFAGPTYIVPYGVTLKYADTFYSPTGTAVDAAGNVYISDMGNHKIVKITAAGVISTLAGGNNTISGDGPGSAAGFYQPSALALDAKGDLFVVDGANGNIRMITPSGIVTTIAGTAANAGPTGTGSGSMGGPGSADGTGPTAGFKTPSGIAIDKNGIIYVSDAGANNIRKIVLQ